MNTPEGEETIFAEALRLPPEERAAYLAQATSGDAGLRQRVESLLGSYGTGDFLEHAAAPQLRQTLDVTVPLTEKPGETIGRYKLREQIGEGGCGVVYVAEQTEPVRRRVALKIIKLGMDTKSVIARFEAERQALALMEHPNIAKVFDAGATETGRPYFVMELVRGMKITDYCDEKKLSTRERLDLFIQVCQAIQHAHQKGIIHRDIKPSNILVTVNDGVPVPKVIDFGIAKATSGQQLTDKTIYTALEQFIGTPAYMSPEQAVLTSVDIDTRSDIYALGVLLYELLTGKTPFDAKELFAIGLDEMRRTIREQEPPRPSTRLSTLPGQELSTTAQRRGLDAPKLVSELRGDLDWIVMKALEKDRARRYDTANGLAADVQRHLNNEPVVACPPSRLYRLKKMARRNRLAFTAAAGVAAALFVGLGIATWMFMRERSAVGEQKRLREQSEVERARSQQVAKFLRDMLKGVRPEKAVGRDTRLLEEIVDEATQRIATELTSQPAVEAEMRHILGITYRDLGRYEKSESMLRRALTLRREIAGDEHHHTASLLNDLGFVLTRENRLEEAHSALREALALRRKLLGDEHRDTVASLENLGVVLKSQGKLEEAEAMMRDALAIQRRLPGSNEIEVAFAMNDLALVLRKENRLHEAEPMLRDVLSMRRKLLSADHPMVAQSLNNLGVLLRDLNNLSEAETLFREALAIREKILDRKHPDLAQSIRNLASLAEGHYRQGNYSKAESLYREAIPWQRAHGPESDNLASVSSLARLLSDWAWAERNEVESAVLGATKIAETSDAVRTPRPTNAPIDMAREAEQLLRGVWEARPRESTNSWRVGDVQSRLGSALVSVAVTDRALGAEDRVAKLTEAESLLLEGNERLQRETAEEKYRRDAVQRLVRLYEAWDKRDKQAEWLQKLELITKAKNNSSSLEEQ